MAGARAKIGTQPRFNFAAMVDKKNNATVKPFNSDGDRWGAIAELPALC